MILRGEAFALKHTRRLIAFAVAVVLLLATVLPAFAYNTLKNGSRGTEVQQMQNALRKLGYSLTADGVFGNGTEKIVRQFQADQGLTADGVAGDKTLTRLYQLTAPTPAPTAAPTSAPVPGGRSATIKTSGAKLNMRSSASTSGTVITKVPNGASVTVLSTQSSWCYIYYDGYYGYVSSTYVVYSTGPVITPVPTAPVKTNTPAATPKATATPSAYTTATISTSGGSLNMRASASTSAKIICTVPNKATVSVLQKGTSWTLITYGNNSGYVSNSYLKFSSPVTPTPAKTAVPTAKPTATPKVQTVTVADVKTSGGSLNMRATASSSAKVVRTLPNGARLTVLSKGSTWTKVEYQGSVGYVSNSYVTFKTITVTSTPVPTSAPTASPTPYVTPKPTEQLISIGTAVIHTSGGGLNMRQSASLAGAVMGTVPNGTAVKVYSYTSSWCMVEYKGEYGYVSTSYLDYTPNVSPTAAPTSAPTPGYDTDLFNRTLRSGTSGNDVRQLQLRLKELNYLSASNVTGSYDTATFNAVKSFQTLSGLTSDGVAGPATFTALFSPYAISYDPSVTSYTTLHIYYRNEGSQNTAAIKKMQTALKNLGYTVNVNGSFDETTYLAVLEFQLRNGMTVTGAVSPAMQVLLYSGKAAGYSAAPSVRLAEGEGVIAGPSKSELQLLHWFNVVKPSLGSSASLLIFDPITHISWTLKVYSKGNHCDSQPASLKDTLLMNKAFGKPSWTVHTVYVMLPDGRWTMATMHNRPHLVGSIENNGFDGHLCVHFLRDIAEVTKNDPDYGLSNQTTLRKSWQTLTGETVN